MGTVRFFGKHAESGSARVGVELDTMVGKNNGTVKGHVYFEVAIAITADHADHSVAAPAIPHLTVTPSLVD